MRSKAGLLQATHLWSDTTNSENKFDLFSFFALVLHADSGLGLLLVTKPLLVKLDLSVKTSL